MAISNTQKPSIDDLELDLTPVNTTKQVNSPNSTSPEDIEIIQHEQKWSKAKKIKLFSCIFAGVGLSIAIAGGITMGVISSQPTPPPVVDYDHLIHYEPKFNSDIKSVVFSKDGKEIDISQPVEESSTITLEAVPAENKAIVGIFYYDHATNKSTDITAIKSFKMSAKSCSISFKTADVIDTVDVTFSVSEDKATMVGSKTISVVKGTIFGNVNTPNVTAKENWVFKGWNYDVTLPVETSVTIEALFDPAPKYYKVKFVENESEYTYSGPTELSIHENTLFSEINKPSPTKDNYYFTHWATKDQEGIFHPITPDTPITSNIEIYPQFVEYPWITDKPYVFYKNSLYYVDMQSLCDPTSPKKLSRFYDSESDEVPTADFNCPLFFGDKITSIPANFLSGCTKFNQYLTFPASITSIGNNFLNNCHNLISTITFYCNLSTTIVPDTNSFAATSDQALQYVNGMNIWVSSQQDKTFMETNFKNSNVSPFRYLLIDCPKAV